MAPRIKVCSHLLLNRLMIFHDMDISEGGFVALQIPRSDLR